MLVRDVMTANPHFVPPSASLQDAVEVMVQHKVRHVPIVEASGKLVGLITDRDLRKASQSPLSQGDSDSAQALLLETKCERIMTRSLVTVRSDDDIKVAVKLMIDSKFGALPVVDAGKLVGIVSHIDVLRVTLKALP